ALQGEGEPIYAPILPGYLGYNPEINKYGFDVAKGSSLLDEAGWKLTDGNPYRTKDGKTLEFSIATVNQPHYVKALTILQENWIKMGIKVNVNMYEALDIQEQIIKPREYEALLFGETLGVDPDPYAFWHSTQMKYPGLGLAVFYQKNIDDLLETARKTNAEEQRRLKYFNFQNILAEELPAVFLYNPYYTYIMTPDIQGVGFQYIDTPSDRLADLTHWYIDTKRIWR
ncbi:MAG: ABC transporter substrate-binding protein, partial [Patescibacteria group bacterium]